MVVQPSLVAFINQGALSLSTSRSLAMSRLLPSLVAQARERMAPPPVPVPPLLERSQFDSDEAHSEYMRTPPPEALSFGGECGASETECGASWRCYAPRWFMVHDSASGSKKWERAGLPTNPIVVARGKPQDREAKIAQIAQIARYDERDRPGVPT